MYRTGAVIVCALLLLEGSGAFIRFSYADTITDLRKKIRERNLVIAGLEKEIEKYQDEISTVNREAKTLQSAIRGIDLARKKLSAEIKVTENKIDKVTLTIEELGEGIDEKEAHIESNRSAIAEAIRSINELEERTLIETLLSGRTLSAFWQRADDLLRFEDSVRTDLRETTELKEELEVEKDKKEENRRELITLKTELSDQTDLLRENRKTKDSLLTATRNKESEYKKLLAEKVRSRDAFERELLEFESQLRLEIDPSSLPQTGTGVLKWPLDAVKITQEFGDTSFARAGGYNGKGHNGIDLRAENGTRVKAALSGEIIGVGNTDTVCPGASYGKWILIKHENGLTTLYAHLSLIKVSVGQMVNTGESIGYSGETGYATGPHLHFTVYATQGVKIMQRKSAVCGGSYTMPIADLKAYLNPLLYL